MNFVTKEQLATMSRLSNPELDALPFGAVGLTDDGRILKYNKYQSELANVDQKAALGKFFFKEIAPCTSNGLFAVNFSKGVAADALDTTFPYTFTYKMKPTNVHVHMYRCPTSKTNWVLVKKA